MNRIKSIAVWGGVFCFLANLAWASTLDEVRKRGVIRCGVNTGLVGFSAPDDKGEWKGLDVDFCRAVSAAVLGSGEKVKFMPLSAKNRFTALQSGEIDILSRNTSWTMSRDVALGFNFIGVTYYDSQGFMINAKKLPEVKSALQLSGATICIQSGTTTELNLATYFKSHGMQYEPIVFEQVEEVNAAYDSGRCDVYTGDHASLHGVKIKLSSPDDNVILPEIVSSEPLGPLVRHGDDQWFDIVKWTYYALLLAEEMGITSGNLEEMKKSTDPQIKLFIGTEKNTNIAESLGLSQDWAYKIIRDTGNYGEIFNRNLGEGSPMKMNRGLNSLWTNGGLQYGMPIR